MIYFDDINITDKIRPSAVTLGKFDGFHRGHQKLIKTVMQAAEKEALATVLFTFNISPQSVIQNRDCRMIVTNEEKKLIAEELGLDVMLECPFTDEIRNMEAGEFVDRILADKLDAKKIVVGDDFRFGKNRSGDAAFLSDYCLKKGIDVIVVEKEKDDNKDISSTYVREELSRGNIKKANELLGYEYFVSGEVVHGAHIGTGLGFPTINIIPQKEKLLPPNGVYATTAQVDDKFFSSITNVGTKPTVDGTHLGIETFIYDFSEDIYGEKVKIKFFDFLRPEKKFCSVEELKTQVMSDIERRKKIV